MSSRERRVPTIPDLPIPRSRWWISLLPPSVVVRVFSPLYASEIIHAIRHECSEGARGAGNIDYFSGTASGEKFKVKWHTVSGGEKYWRHRRRGSATMSNYGSTTIVSGRIQERDDGSIVTLRVRQSMSSILHAVAISVLVAYVSLTINGFHGEFGIAAMYFLGTYTLLMALSLWMAVKYILPQVKALMYAQVTLDELVNSVSE